MNEFQVLVVFRNEKGAEHSQVLKGFTQAAALFAKNALAHKTSDVKFAMVLDTGRPLEPEQVTFSGGDARGAGMP